MKDILVSPMRELSDVKNTKRCEQQKKLCDDAEKKIFLDNRGESAHVCTNISW